ncbi:MAG: hypothetical protein IPI22_14175 [Bacteroidetes bacterium]|nr:hypothetical protein [Bacteroidota bacterium]
MVTDIGYEAPATTVELGKAYIEYPPPGASQVEVQLYLKSNIGDNYPGKCN